MKVHIHVHVIHLRVLCWIKFLCLHYCEYFLLYIHLRKVCVVCVVCVCVCVCVCGVCVCVCPHVCLIYAVVQRCFKASLMDSLERVSLCFSTNSLTESPSVLPYCLRAQPMALRIKNSSSWATDAQNLNNLSLSVSVL